MTKNQIRYVKIEDLRPADLLFYTRHSPIGRAIRVLDRTDASHAGLFMVDEVAEAVGEGLLHRRLPESLGTDRRDYIQVCRRKTPLTDTTPVLRVAESYLKSQIRYAYSEVLLCAFLSLARHVALTRASRVFIRRVLDKAAGVLLGAGAGVRPEQLMCSEFVYRCYDEAVAPSGRPWTIQIARAGEIQDAPPESRGGQIGGGRPLQGTLLDQARDVWDEPRRESPGSDSLSQELQPPPDVSQADVERAALEYEAEVASGTAAESALGDDADDDELLASMRRFARSLGGPQPEGRRQSAAQVPSFHETLKLVANFVSPGDLYTSPSLEPIGRLTL